MLAIERHAAAISPASAAALSILFILIYIVPFYLSPTTRPSLTLNRDAPSVIRARIRSVIASCILSSSITIYAITTLGGASLPDTLHLLGWWPTNVTDIARCMLLVAVLFAGPLFEAGVVEGQWRDWATLYGLRETLASWQGYRNIVVAPLSEEIIWRSFMIPPHLLAHIPAKTIVFATPLYFGLAHFHHLYEFRITHPSTPWAPAVLRSLFQFTYTSLFGFFASFLYLRTGNVWACALTHAFCNYLGIPRVWGRVGQEVGEAIGEGGLGREGEGEGPAQEVKEAMR
ncbi:CAAX prenyl protease, partial [Cryomyces antarcticus]